MSPLASEAEFAAWWIAARACDARIDVRPDLADAEVEAIQGEKHGYEALIASRRADSKVGLLVKARLLHQWLSRDGDEFGAGLAAEIIAWMEVGQ
ncbi:MAG: hypothetical protein ACRED4_02770 [Brevundimonas sp.]